MAMAYIVAVNPNLLAQAGIPFSAALTATCFGAALCTIAMGLIANRPIALASAMGINAMVVYTLCLGDLGIDWRVAMAVIFLLVLCGLRKAVMDAIPLGLRRAIGIGIGIFIALIGLSGSKLIVPDEASALVLGDLSSPVCIVALVSLLSAIILHVLNIKGGLVFSILIATLVGIPLGVTTLPTSWNFGLDFQPLLRRFKQILKPVLLL